jgi:hypothetical protein
VTDDERLELYAELAAMLRAAGLTWVVDEVSAFIAQGLEEEVTAAEWAGSGKPTRGETRTTRREFTPVQRIHLLLDALRRVVIDGAAVELAVATKFYSTEILDRGAQQIDVTAQPTDPPKPLVVSFAPEPSREDPEPTGFEVADPREIAPRQEAAADLLEQLEAVAAEAAS